MGAAPSFWQSLSRASYFGGAAGMTGAAVGWVGSQGLTSLGPVISSYGALDLVVLALLGAGIGGLVGAGSASLREEPVARSAGVGLLLGAGGAAAGGLIAFLVAGVAGLDRSAAGFLVTRALVWALAGGALGAAVAAPAAAGGRIRLGRSSLGGALGGLLGAGLLSAPGPSSVWQLIGFLMIGVLVGYGCLAAVPGSWVIERVPSGRPAGLWQHREWEVGDQRPASIGDQVRVESVAGQGRVVPAGTGGSLVTVGGRVIRTATSFQPGDRIRIGDHDYLIRRTGGGR